MVNIVTVTVTVTTSQVAGKGLLQGAILKSMALKEGSGRTETWLMPEKMNVRVSSHYHHNDDHTPGAVLQAHLTGYGFHVENPDEVVAGAKPRLKEVCSGAAPQAS